MCCGVMVKAVDHYWLYPTSILEVYKVFNHRHMLWMGICVHLTQLYLCRWRKPNFCTVQIHTLGVPGIRPDTRRVSKARQFVPPHQKLMWHTCHIIRVMWHTHHSIALLQDCSRGLHSYVSARYIGHSDASTLTKIFRPIYTPCGNLHREHR